MIYELSQYFYKLAKEHFVFSYDILNNLEYTEEKAEYLEKFFPIIAQGSRRTVFIKNSKKVIKLMHFSAGNENKIESEILQNNNSTWLPKFYSNAPDYLWIEVELVRPLKGSYEIEELINVNGKVFIELMKELYRNDGSTIFKILQKDLKIAENELKGLHPRYPELKKETIRQINKLKSYLENQYLKELDNLFKITELDPREFSYVFNLGKSASGNLVLLDVGKTFK